MRFRLALIVALLATLPAAAEVLGDNDISVIATSQTITFARASSSVSLCNATTSANEVYGRLFTDVDTPDDATTSSPIRLDPGVCFDVIHNPRTEGGSGYLYVSLVCDTAETATARLLNK